MEPRKQEKRADGVVRANQETDLLCNPQSAIHTPQSRAVWLALAMCLTLAGWVAAQERNRVVGTPSPVTAATPETTRQTPALPPQDEPPARANTRGGLSMEELGERNLNRALAATVRILAGNFDARGVFRRTQTGSGVIISPEGLVLTTYDLAHRPNGQPFELWAGLLDAKRNYLPPNRAQRLRLVQADRQRNLALLQLEGGAQRYPALKLGRTDNLNYSDSLRVIGFAPELGTRTSVTEVSVLQWDEGQGTLLVEGDLLKGLAGGAVIAENGALLGVPVGLLRDQSVPFLDGNNVPQGEVLVDVVGVIRTAEDIQEFLRGTPSGGSVQLPPALAGTTISGAVTDKATNQPIPGAAVGVLVPGALANDGYASRDELAAYGRTDMRGGFALNRQLRPGRYLVKVVQPGYATLLQEVTLPTGNDRLILQMVRSR